MQHSVSIKSGKLQNRTVPWHANNKLSLLVQRIFNRDKICSVPQGFVLGPLLCITVRLGVFLDAFADDVHCCHVETASAAAHWNTALQTSATGCPRTDWSWTRTRRSCYGSDRDKAFGEAVDFQCCILVMTPLKIETTSVCSVWNCRLISTSIDKPTSSARLASTGYGSYGVLSGHWTRIQRLVHVFVSSRVDHYNAVLAGDPKVTTDKLQRVLNAAARVVSDTHKFDRGLSRLLHTELHWLSVPERVSSSWCSTACTPVHRRPLPVCLQCRLQTTSSLCQPKSSRCASPLSQ